MCFFLVIIEVMISYKDQEELVERNNDVLVDCYNGSINHYYNASCSGHLLGAP